MERTQYLSRSEVRFFTRKSDFLAWKTLVTSWAGIFAIFWVVANWTHHVTLFAALLLLPGRQLALAVITHECGHGTFFNSKVLNRWVGQYLAANPVFTDMHNYARGHTQHHQLAGTHDDPDLPNYQAYPVSTDSFKRKVLRDLTGQTGYKLMRFILSSAMGILSDDDASRARAKPFLQQIMMNLILAVLLAWLFAPWAYLLWLGAYMTTYMLVVRIRQVAEHANVPDLYDSDPRNNTRTTIPSWWERLVFAPNNVNYHMEHHFMAAVPCYRLKELHQLLRQRGAYTDTPIFHGYSEVLRHAIA
ncbi:MAG: fatty acid desaturase family protein [Pseudomonadota bacterium]